jgi:hypothetical protein
MERDGFIFYKSFRECIDGLSDDIQLKFYRALTDYALYGKEDVEDIFVKSLMMLIKPQIDANNKRYEGGKKGAEHGKKGGRPPKEETNPKETPKKPQRNPSITPNKPLDNPTKTPKDKDKDKDNVNVNVDNSSTDVELMSPSKIVEDDVEEKFDVVAVVKLWNAHTTSFCKVKALSKTRKEKTKLRIKEWGSKERYLALLEAAEASDFCKEGGWFNFDWLIKNDNNWLKLEAGNYWNKNPSIAPRRESVFEHSRKQFDKLTAAL